MGFLYAEAYTRDNQRSHVNILRPPLKNMACISSSSTTLSDTY